MFDNLYKTREVSAAAYHDLSVQLSRLAVNEEDLSFSFALTELANLHKKLEEINLDQNQQEFSLLNELLNEHLLQLHMVNCAFNERKKLHKCWLLSMDTLQRSTEKVGNSSIIFIIFKE